MDYGKAVRICRAAFGLTQAELAARLKAVDSKSIGASQLSLIESGKRQPSSRAVENLSAALGVPRSLMMLLASEPDELSREDEEIVSHLAKKLLYLLAEASVQQELSFGGEQE